MKIRAPEAGPPGQAGPLDAAAPPDAVQPLDAAEPPGPVRPPHVAGPADAAERTGAAGPADAAEPIDRATADTYAAWFRALADGTRVQVVSLLARSSRPLTVKEITATVAVGQSTVSEHLRQLAAVGFVLAEERGTSRLYRINQACVEGFPTAADLVLSRPSPLPPGAPW